MFTLVRMASFLAVATLTVAVVALMPALASEGTPKTFPETHAFVQYLGSKQAVGSFIQDDGACLVTLVVTEAYDPVQGSNPATPARITMRLSPENSATLESAEHKALTVICSEDATSVSVEVNTVTPL
jgi:hypothetical protein